MPSERPLQLRLFVACELSDEVRAGLGRIQDELRRMGAGRLRWVRPEGIHITLKFLGDVDEPRVDELSRSLAEAIEPFELRVRPGALGAFGGNRLRVVWVGLEGDIDVLAGLAGRVETALEPLGFPKERRPFAAHLTLARVPDGVPVADRQQLASLIERYSPQAMPSMTVTEVALIQSTLRPGGSVYHRLATFPRRA